MADLSRAGMVLSSDQIRADRIRRGYCDTCHFDPVRCYEIKKRYGGIMRERVPLNIPGKVCNGLCLDCHPDKDPDIARRKTRVKRRTSHHHQHRDRDPEGHPHHHSGQENNGYGRQGSRQLPYDMDVDEEEAPRSPSLSNAGGRMKHRPSLLDRHPLRQQGFRNLADSLKDTVGERDDDFHRQRSHPEADFERDDEGGRSPGEREENEYVEEIEYNIFNEPVKVRKLRRVSKEKSHSQYGAKQASPHSPTPMNGANSHNSPNRQGSQRKPPPPFPHEEHAPVAFGDAYRSGGGGGAPRRDSGPPRHPPPPHGRNNSGRYDGRASPEEEDRQKMPGRAAPEPLPAESNRGTTSSRVSGESMEEMDELARLCAQHIKKNVGTTVKFTPNMGTILPQAQLEVEDLMDEISVLTPDSYFQGRPSVATVGTATRQASSRIMGLGTIGEGSSGGEPPDVTPMVSHQIREPAVPSAVAAQVSPPPRDTKGSDMETYLEENSPSLVMLREVVGESLQAGEDGFVIETVTGALIHDNATAMSQDLALFCLTTLWVLARKSDKNKRQIIFEDKTLDAIVEAMQIYRDGSSAQIQTRACGVLWSLSMDPNDRKHVAQGRGCQAILDAMRLHADDDALQVMALGAVKVLSFDNVGRSALVSAGGPNAVSGVMRRHVRNPTVQSEGCVILGNLAVDPASQFVAPATEDEIDAIVCGVLEHRDSLEVHEAACFTLMSLASSTANVELIHRNGMARHALEIAFQKHPDDVGVNILTLWKRLRFDANVMAEGINSR